MIKSKHFLVVAFSSIIIGVVLVSTVIGYTLYIEWKNNSLALRYNNSISKITAEMFRKEIDVSNVKINVSREEPFSGTPLLEGSLKNNSEKTIISILMEVSFQKPNGLVVYKDWLHPIGKERFGSPAYLSGVEHTRNVLLPGESVSFRHLLRNCPPVVVSQFSSKAKFAKTRAEDKITLNYSITGVTVL
ncbi:MAG: hypothetical protein WBB66_03915 [Candidatus Omnitrophota bacterium]